MARLRIRHPNGIAQCEIDLDGSTVLDLQQKIEAETKILPSRQVLRTGYPPRALELIPELPLSSLGIQSGDQLIVSSSDSTTPSASRGTPAAALSRPPTNNASTPASVAPATQTPAKADSGGPDFVPTDAGVLIHRIVPDDNSCLFSSLALIFVQDINQAQAVRQAAADVIRSDPTTFSDAILGQPREEYLKTILKPNTWGGAIELLALATRYGAEIASIDVETGRVDTFAPPSGSQNRCIVLYSGIHYDAATLAPTADAPAEWHQTQFSATGSADTDPIVQAAKKLADKLRAKHAFTNTTTFTLRCEICKTGLTGEKEARAHAAQTGHTSFGEY